MSTFLSSKVVVRETSPGVRLLAGGDTAITAMIGLSEKGPVATPVLSTSFEEWKEIFGGYTTLAADTVANVQGFFEEGGQFLYFSRTAHWLDINDASRGTTMLSATVDLDTEATSLAPATISGSRSGPFVIPDGSVLKIFVDGSLTTTDITFTEDTPASVSATIAATVDLSTGTAEIALDIDNAGVETIAFTDSGPTPNVVDITAVTRLEIVTAINAVFPGVAAVTGTGYSITSTTKGSSSEIDVQAAHANTGLTVAVTNGVDNDMADENAVTIGEVVTAIAAAGGITASNVGGKVKIDSDTSGASSSLDVDVTDDSIIADALGLPLSLATGTDAVAAAPTLQVDAKYPGAYGNDLSVTVLNATSGTATEFNLQVFKDGFLQNTYPNLTMADIETVINDEVSGDPNIQVVALGATRPANVVATALAGGSDGDPVDDNDFIGVSSEENGLHAFDDITDISLLVCPARITAITQQAMLNWAAGRNYEVFVILDTPELLTAQGARSYVVDNSIEGASELGCINWPHVRVRNPAPNVLGTAETLTVPGCGFDAGRFARTDASRPGGIYDAPAGQLNGAYRTVLGFELLPGKTVAESDAEHKRDLVYPHSINPRSTSSGVPALDGVKTLKANGNFPKINKRRGASYIERILRKGLDSARFRNIGEELISEVDRAARNFLLNQMRLGAFVSNIPEEAFLVDTGPGVNTAAVNAQGILRIRIGLAMANPAEFIDIVVGPDTVTE